MNRTLTGLQGPGKRLTQLRPKTHHVCCVESWLVNCNLKGESWLAHPWNNTHRKVYLGPPLSSLSPFLSYVLLLSLIDSRSASSSVASLNTVRISKKNTGSSSTSSCHECLKAHLFHGNFSTPSLCLHWKLLRIWILCGARRLCTKDQSCLYQLHETFTTSKHEKWWNYRNMGKIPRLEPFTTPI